MQSLSGSFARTFSRAGRIRPANLPLCNFNPLTEGIGLTSATTFARCTELSGNVGVSSCSGMTGPRVAPAGGFALNLMTAPFVPTGPGAFSWVGRFV